MKITSITVTAGGLAITATPDPEQDMDDQIRNLHARAVALARVPYATPGVIRDEDTCQCGHIAQDHEMTAEGRCTLVNCACEGFVP